MKFSKRAQVLAKVLEFINNDDWEDRGDFFVFGKEAFELHEAGGQTEDPTFDSSLRSLVTKIKVNEGERTIAMRTSLEAIPKSSTLDDLFNWLQSQTPEFLSSLAELVRTNPTALGSATIQDADALDAALASAALQTLDETVARISTLDEVDLGLSSPRGAEYFRELHRCDCFGLNIAAAVLSRAMLEAALIDVIDPKPHKYDSIGQRINAAKSTGHLDEERKTAAFEIRDAGDAAIHDLDKFKKSYQAHVRRIVDNTRKVLVDLYS